MMTSLIFALVALTVPGADDPTATRIVGHRGLLRHAPENTLAGFGACADLRVGFELDVRRSRDGHLVVLHDADVKRTTNGKGKVADLTLADLKKLDAGARFDPAFAGQRVPALDEVFALLKERRAPAVLVAVDIKIDDADLPKDLAALARKHGVVGQLVCIGLGLSPLYPDGGAGGARSPRRQTPVSGRHHGQRARAGELEEGPCVRRRCPVDRLPPRLPRNLAQCREALSLARTRSRNGGD